MNMSRTISFSLLCTFLILAFSLSNVQAATPKIGFISGQSILFGCQDGQAAKQELDAKQDKLREQFTPEGAKLEALVQEIEKKQSVWSADVLSDKKREASRMERDLKMKAEDAQYEVTELRKKLLEPIVNKLANALKKFAEAEGYTMIIDSDVAARSGMIVYGDPSLDLTDIMIKKVDAIQ